MALLRVPPPSAISAIGFCTVAFVVFDKHSAHADAQAMFRDVWLGRATPLARCLLISIIAVPVLAQQPRPQILSRLTWFDRAGTRTGRHWPGGRSRETSSSRQTAGRVAVAVTDHAHETRDIWIYDAHNR